MAGQRIRLDPVEAVLDHGGDHQVADARDDLAGVILCPSNPYLSIDPILAVPGVRAAIRACGAPVTAVSPVVGGKAIKGPTAKMMRELGIEPGVAAIARHYEGLIDRLVIDRADESAAGTLPCPTLVTESVMVSDADRIALARATLSMLEPA